MLRYLVFFIFILLNACTTLTSVPPYRGMSFANVLQQLGRPNEAIKYPDGSARYIYTYEQPVPFSSPSSSNIVIVTGNKTGKTIGAMIPSANLSRNITHCTMVLVANASGVITEVQSQGMDCHKGQ